MESVNRTWIAIGGVVGLLVVGLVLKHHGSSDDEQKAAAQKRMMELAAVTGNERGGWRTRESGEDLSASGGEAAAHGAGTARGRALGRAGAGRAAGDSAGGSSSPGGAIGLRGRGRAGGSLGRVGGGVAADSDGIQIAPVAPIEKLPGDKRAAAHGPFGTAAEGGIGPRDVVPPSQNVAAQDAQADPDHPVYSLPLDGSTEPVKADNPPAQADGVTFDSGTGAVFSTDSQLVVPNAANITGKAGTISFWLQPQWQGNDGSDAYLLDLRTPNVWENRLEIGKNGDNLRVLFFPDTGQETGIGLPIKDWQPNDWHNISTTWGPDSNGVNMLSVYVDGNLVDSKPYDGQLQVPQQPLIIGNSTNRDVGARGAISSFQVYNTNLQQDRIAGIAAQPPQ